MPWIYDEVGIFWRIKHSDRIRIDTSMNGVKTLEKNQNYSGSNYEKNLSPFPPKTAPAR